MKMMKQFSQKMSLLLITLLSSTVYLKAAILTVNNSLPSSTIYSQIDAAITAATPGDTIYVSGSSVTYNNCTISKSITLIGSGTYTLKQNAFPTSISIITFNSNVTNVKIMGFNIINGILFNGKNNISNVEISYNLISEINMASISNSYNFLFSSNVFSGGAYSIACNSSINLNNLTIQNNIISRVLQGFNVGNVLIQNNVFYNVLGSVAVNAQGASNASFLNNIFLNTDPLTNTTNCTYLNNISYSTTLTYPSMGTSNFDNTNPQFINAATSGSFLSSYDYHLLSSSVGHNAGTDGKDIGLYGGTTNVSTLGESFNVPVIRQMYLLNSNVAQNGTLNVNVRSTKSGTK